MTVGHNNAPRITRILAAAILLALLLAVMGVPAAAVNNEGLLVETLCFRDVLRLYMLDKASFGENALAEDANGITNAAKRLAEMFSYTVGLNYEGKGENADFFGKDVTAQMGQAPYIEANLQAEYNVEIAPVRSYALALPKGTTTDLRVYLTGYVNPANGVLPVLHYVWQDNGSWYAVKDDNPFYRVSYNGLGARQLTGTGLTLCRNRSTGGGTDMLEGWTDLASAPDGNGVVHLDSGTLVVGQGTANIFGITDDFSRVQREGNYSAALLAVSDFKQGDTTFQTGPLVFSRTVYELDTMRRVPDGEQLEEGVSYRFKVVYDEALTVAAGAGWNDVGLYVRSEVTGQSKAISDFIWYGGAEYLSSDKYNPHTLEFTFTPSDEGRSVCTFIPVNLAGSESRLKSADFHTRTQTVTVAASAEPSPGVVLAAAPLGAPSAGVTSAPTVTEAPAAAPAEPAATAAPAAEPTPRPTEAPQAAPAAAQAPVTAPPPARPRATLAVLFGADPYSPISRGVMAETLWILSGLPAAENAGFSDQGTDTDLIQAVAWADRSGIIPGRGDRFGTNDPISREEIATILFRYAAQRGKDMRISSDMSAWADGAAVSAGNHDAVIWALERGVMTGFADGYLHPAQNVLCGEAIEMIKVIQQTM